MRLFFSEKKIDEKNENDLNSSNQVQEEVVKEKPKLKKFESFDERRTQDILSQPREEVNRSIHSHTRIGKL